ncbi:MAG: sulfotransferase [Planctomycetota bacterium]
MTQDTDTVPGAPSETSASANALQRVFVIGFPRSGTTWAMYLLTQHPAVVGAQQTGLFHALQPLEDWWHRAGGAGRRVVTADHSGAGEGAFERRRLADTLGHDTFYEVAREVADRVFRRVTAVLPSARAVVEQTPENIEFASLIQRLYPDAYFLHMVRDPRAVFSSWRKSLQTWAKHNEFVSSPVQVARKWCEYDERGHELAAQTERYRLVRYEDLLANGPEMLEELCAWVGLPADRAFCEQAVEACSIDKMKKNVDAPKGFFRTGRADSWREEVPSSALKIIEHVARDTMERLGYECVTKRSARPPARLWAYDTTSRLLAGAKNVVSPELRRRVKSMLRK